MLRARDVEFYTALAALRDSQHFSVVEFVKFVNKIRESVSGSGVACRVQQPSVQCTLDWFAKTYFVDSDLPIQSLSSLGQ